MGQGASTAGTGRRPGIQVLTWPVFDGLALEAVVTTRYGGASTGPYESLNLGLHVGDDPDVVVANRRRAARSVGLDLADLVFCAQVHGRAVAVVDDSHRGSGGLTLDDAIPDVDALVTAAPGVGLVVLVADCVPIVLYEPVAQVVACVHAGWRGTVAHVAAATVGTMTSLGARAERIVVGIGPAIPWTNYEVGAEVVDAARAGFSTGPDELIRPVATGRWLFDLPKANHRVLTEAGVLPANIDLARIGTGAGTPFFSHRAVQPCGRFAVIAALRPVTG